MNRIGANPFHSLVPNNFSSLGRAFEQNVPLIEKTDYTNKGMLLHNNVADVVLDENIVEYRLHIDSIDRDIEKYPDPFSFTVKFNPVVSGFVQEEVWANERDKSKGTKIKEIKLNGPSRPFITKQFKNVKYFKLENIILPKHIGFTEGMGEYDKDLCLLKDRFLYLVIKEIDLPNVLSTSDTANRIDEDGDKGVLPTPFSLLIPDKIFLNNFYSANPFYGNKVYKNSALGNITQLSFEFYDSFGAKIKFNDLLYYDQCSCDNLCDIRHPLNQQNQIHMSFLVGVVENQINTNTNF